KLNTDALEYAPCLSADRLELYFTRASKKAVAGDTKKPEPYLRIMVARRKNCFSPYEQAEKLAALAGFIEAPTITDDKKKCFSTKKLAKNSASFAQGEEPRCRNGAQYLTA
ncbi:MAG: hypothetical protein IT342_06405, partial [Candidatus Melainabacteria bacterium]|nr:hypothetical protein [Candidatus Melainabacteria bacterium]